MLKFQSAVLGKNEREFFLNSCGCIAIFWLCPGRLSMLIAEGWDEGGGRGFEDRGFASGYVCEIGAQRGAL